MTNKINLTQDIEMIIKALSKPDKPFIDIDRVEKVSKFLNKQIDELILLKDEYNVHSFNFPITFGIGLLKVSGLRIIQDDQYGLSPSHKRKIIFPTKGYSFFCGTRKQYTEERDGLFLGFENEKKRVIGRDYRDGEHRDGIEGKLDIIIGKHKIEKLFLHKYKEQLPSYLTATNQLDIGVSPKLKQEYLKGLYHRLLKDDDPYFLNYTFIETGLHKGKFIYEPKPGLTLDIPKLIKQQWKKHIKYFKEKNYEIPKELD